MTGNGNGDAIVPSDEYIAAAREFVRLTAVALGEIPATCSRSYALMSAAFQGLLPAVLEAADPGQDGDAHDQNSVSFAVQGIGAGMTAYLARPEMASSRGIYLALIHDLVRGMINVETTFEPPQAHNAAHELLAAFGIMTPGKGIN